MPPELRRGKGAKWQNFQSLGAGILYGTFDERHADISAAIGFGHAGMVYDEKAFARFRIGQLGLWPAGIGAGDIVSLGAGFFVFDMQILACV